MKKKLKITLLSGSLILIGWLAYFLAAPQFIFNAAMITAGLAAGYEVALTAYRTLKRGVVSINALVTIAAVGAVIIGEYWEAAAVTFLFVLGNYLEARTTSKTRSAIRELMELSPTTAIVIRDGEEVEIAPREVKIGETVIVRPGEKISVDGEVTKGTSEVNQAAITGESKPVTKEVGDEVYSGTLNNNGYLEVEAQKVGRDTTFSRIIQLVEEAQEEKAPTQKLMEKFSQYYTPGIILLSLAAFLVTQNIKLALTLLVIGCPGALVISTPISIVAGIGNAARNGVLIKGGEHLEQAGDIDTIVFDKTGTLTKGEPEVTDVIVNSGSEPELLVKAASVEQNSEHHLAQAIVNQVEQEKLSSAEDFTVKTGRGITAQVAGAELVVGNLKLMKEKEINVAENLQTKLRELEAEGKTVVIAAEDQQVLGLIAIADTLRSDAEETITKLKRLNIDQVTMLTGDNQRVAQHIAKKLQLDDYQAELLPEKKVEAVKKLQAEDRTVAMVGDGINDAPSLATADVGIAMGAAGTDVAIDTADITLMADKLAKLPFAVGLSKATNRNIKQNIVFAVLVVAALLAGVLGGVVFLASGMLVHEASVMLVIFNAMRLMRYEY